ncbi:MAG: hypothetical protein ACK40M_11840 [Flavobacteriales bacterium]
MIYDCFTFFNELDLLEIRLNTLSGVVDKFVLVEATQTHQGKEKPLHYQRNKDRFSAFHDRIIHVVVDTYPENPNGDSWVLEKHQRNSIAIGLKDAKPDDVVLISDVDEIPKPEVIVREKNSSGVRIFRQRMFYYYLNCINATEVGKHPYFWNGTIMVNKSEIKGSIQDFRELGMKLLSYFHSKPAHRFYWRMKLRSEMRALNVRFVEQGGWHFSYLGGVDRIITKLEAFAHSEYNKPEYKDPERIRKAIVSGEDIFGRGFKYRFVPIDSTWPSHIVQHREKYAALMNDDSTTHA